MTLCCNITMGFPINVILTEETGLDFFNGFICPNIPVWSLSPSKFTLPLLLPPPLLLTLFRLLRVAPGPPSMMPVITDQVLGLMNTEITGNILWFLQHSRIQLFRVDFFFHLFHEIVLSILFQFYEYWNMMFPFSLIHLLQNKFYPALSFRLILPLAVKGQHNHNQKVWLNST